ncbi:MAG: cbb3-type cytochrome c oxidase subunit I [Nitrospirae bacterium]|nr:cbb3-type cytochrome c oxidase subunit I [Nitrospirota bacterium]
MLQAWLLLAVLSLGAGGGFAFLVAMSRTPFGHHYFPPEYFYYALVGHVDFAIVLWLASFTVLLWNREFAEKREPVSVFLAYLGFLMAFAPVLLGRGHAVPNNYVPVLIDPLFLSGLALFFLAFLINVVKLLPVALRSLLSGSPVRQLLSISVVTAGLMIGAVPIAMLKLGGAEVGGAQDPATYYERLFWIPGHIQQFLNGLVLAAVWYLLAKIHEAQHYLLRYANLCLLVCSVSLFALPFLVADPPSQRLFTDLLYAVGLGVPMLAHLVVLARRLRGDLFTLSHAPLFLSMVLFLLGIGIAYLGLKNDLRIPAHYHGVITSLTLALMGFSYALLRERRALSSARLTAAQLYLYGMGMLLFIVGLFWAGWVGAPRKVFGVAYTQDPLALVSLSLMGVGTLCAFVAGVWFVVYLLRVYPFWVRSGV